MFEITCIFCHFSTIRFLFETLGLSKAFSGRSLRIYRVYTVTFREMNYLRALKQLLLKGFLGNRTS